MSFDFEKFVSTYFVHQETIDFYKARSQDNVKPYYEVGVEEARKTSLATALKYSGNVELDGEEKDIVVPSPYDKDGIPVTLYCPAACDNLPAPTILVYFHGGGNTIGSRKTHVTVCKILARDSPCIVANVEYRLAPEHKFPANNDDAKCVVEWMAANKSVVGGSKESKLGVAGDSAGGRLSAVVSHEAYQLIDFAVLIYPNVSCRFEHPSVVEFGEGPSLSKLTINWFMEQYITEKDLDDARASVIRNKEFSYLPPTLIIVADLDTLRDGCYAYYEKLKEAGVKVEMKTVKGVPHAFWSLQGAFKETCKEAHGAAVKFIQQQSA
ncbi:hypothetical protein ACF0H5_022528 [Mactra antiquata]